MGGNNFKCQGGRLVIKNSKGGRLVIMKVEGGKLVICRTCHEAVFSLLRRVTKVGINSRM